MLRFYLLLTSLLGMGLVVQAQAPVTVAEQQYLQNRALSRVKTYSEYLEMIADTKKGGTEERIAYKQVIILTAGKDGSATRVFNDLVPPQVLLNDNTIEKTVQLDPYIKSIAEFYKEGLVLNYSNYKASDIYYSQTDDWYFVKVTADRKLNGVYQHGTQNTPYSKEDKVDFFVSGSRVNGMMKIGGIYGVQPHEAKAQYVKARIIMGDNDSPIELVGKPIRVDEAAITSKLKRGKGYHIAWEGGLKDDIVQVELLAQDSTKKKKDRLIIPMMNAGYYLFRPSGKANVGEYTFKITNISTGRTVITKPFKIVRKVPLGVTVSGAGVVTGIVSSFIIPPPPPPPNPTIADPPLPNR